MADDRDSGAAGTPVPDWDALARYLAGEGDAVERARMARTLAVDPARSTFLNALDEALRSPMPAALTPTEVEAALAVVLARREESATVLPLRPRVRRWPVAGLRAAAAVLIVAGAALTWRMMSRSALEGGNTGRQFATGVGVVDSLVLPDSSVVILGPASTVTLSAGYGAASRELTLHGQALFDVRHDASRPFVVRTAAAELRDVGTRFAVESQGAEELRVAVLDGAVAVRSAHRTRTLADTLRARDRGVLLPGGVFRVERQAVAGVGEDVAWTGRQLSLRDASVTQVAGELARWYGLSLRVTDSTLRTRRLTATFEQAPREEIARVLAAALGGTSRLAGDTLWILPVSGSPAHR
jgi:transmembrane sensor